MNTSIANTMANAEDKTTLDRHVVNLFSHKAVLATLMMYCVREFTGVPATTIAEECFVGDPVVKRIAVHRDEPDAEGALSFPPMEIEDLEAEAPLDANARIQGLESADKTQREGAVFYDVIFMARVPGTDEIIRLIVNVEIQNDANLAYDVVTRGLYYCARMLSAQKNRVFEGMDYGKLMKVYSIWICPYAASGVNAVAAYNVQKEAVYGQSDTPKAAYDKLETVVITMNAEGLDSPNALIRYLSLLLNREMPLRERQECLESEYHIPMTDAIRKDVSTLCNYSEAIERRGIAIGEARGITIGEARGITIGEARGEARGKETGAFNTLVSLVREQLLSVKDAAAHANLSEDEFLRKAGLTPRQ